YIQRGQPDAGFPLFESGSLKWPGFVEFDDVNGKLDMKGYEMDGYQPQGILQAFSDDCHENGDCLVFLHHVYRLLGLWVISGYGLSTCFLHSFSFPRFYPIGFYLERFFNETDFVDNMCDDVINTLQRKNSHIPYRNNKLTQVLILKTNSSM
ncbi:hypothetical protein Tco_0807337, partial [Tanacetum coccineum]